MHLSLRAFITLLLLSTLVAQPAIAKTSKEVLAEKTAREFAKHLEDKNYAAIDKLIDVQAMCDRISERLYDNAVQRKVFDLRECAVYKKRSFSALILQSLHSQSFSTRYIGKSSVGANTVRLVFSEGGLEFIELLFAAEDSSKISDFYLATNGRFISRTIAENIGLLSQQSDSIIKNLFGIGKIKPEAVKTVREIGENSKNGNFKGVLTQIESLPIELKRSRNFLVMKVFAAANLDEDTHLAALAELDKFHGHDSSLTMMLLDYYLINNDFEKLDVAFKKLKSRYTDDASIMNLEANIQFTKGNSVRAMQLAEECLAKEPTLFDGHYTRLYLLINEDRLDEAKRAYQLMLKQFDDALINQLLEEDPALAEWN